MRIGRIVCALVAGAMLVTGNADDRVEARALRQTKQGFSSWRTAGARSGTTTSVRLRRGSTRTNPWKSPLAWPRAPTFKPRSMRS